MSRAADKPMINIAKVSDWLTQNANDHVYPRLFLMSPNGTLLAYSKPVDIKELRDQAALISMAWKDSCSGRQLLPTRSNSAQDVVKAALKTLTIETEDCNIIIRLLQPELLLVLIGRLHPGKKQSFKITSEGGGDSRYPEIEVPTLRPNLSSTSLQDSAAAESSEAATKEATLPKGKTPSLGSHMSQLEKDFRIGTLHVQRKRLDALADYILNDFEEAKFVMPADSDLQ